MKGCAFKLLLSLAGMVGAMAAISVGLQYWLGLAPMKSWPAALIGGVFLWVAANLAKSAVAALRERAALKAGLSGATPADGRQTILSGHIEPMGATLRAPLSGRECVAYTFEIYTFLGTGKQRRRVVLCDGVALTPSMIVTRVGSFRLLAVPELQCDESAIDDAAMERAREIMRSTPYEGPAGPSARPSIEEQWNDTDGEFRRHRRHAEEDGDSDEWRLSECAIDRGAAVCVFGEYSAAKRAIVADPNDWSKITRVMKGDAESIVQKLGGSVIRRAIGALIATAAPAGVVAAFVAG